jgi:hypothetical protein
MSRLFRITHIQFYVIRAVDGHDVLGLWMYFWNGISFHISILFFNIVVDATIGLKKIAFHKDRHF